MVHTSLACDWEVGHGVDAGCLSGIVGMYDKLVGWEDLSMELRLPWRYRSVGLGDRENIGPTKALLNGWKQDWVSERALGCGERVRNFRLRTDLCCGTGLSSEERPPSVPFTKHCHSWAC